MKILTCAGYFSSGSSAITDLFAEYESVKATGNYEFRFLHDIDGVSDLEFHLVECHNRHNSGHALKRFYKLSKFNSGSWYNSRYEPFFDNRYLELTKKYIKELTDFSYRGWWFYDLYDKGKFYYYRKLLRYHLLCKLPWKTKGILKKEITYCTHPTKEKFLSATKEYVSDLMHAANKENKEFLSIDQIVPSSNQNRILRYFSDDIKVVTVCRDPRDTYISAKLYYRYSMCPINDVNAFCDWYEYVREAGNNETPDQNKVLAVRFEDIIYDYDNVVKKIEDFTGLKEEDHNKKFSKMNPKRSVVNTMLYKKHEELAEDIKVIEKRLAKYLYPFEEMKDKEIKGIAVQDKKVF